MAPKRRSSEGLIARVNFPLYSVQILTNRYIIVGGGGGSAKTGVANGFESRALSTMLKGVPFDFKESYYCSEVYEITHDGVKFIAQEVFRHETGPKVVMNFACYNDGKRTYLAAGQESHCQLYNVNFNFVRNPSESVIANGGVDGNIRRRRTSSQSNNGNVHGHYEQKLKLDFKAGDSVQTDFDPTEPVQRVVKISKCGKMMVTGGTDGEIRLWSFPSLRPMFSKMKHDKEIDDIDFSPDSTMIVSIAKDKQAVVWNINSGKKMHNLVWNPENGVKFLYKKCRFGPVEGELNKSRIYTASNSIGRNGGAIIHQWDSKIPEMPRKYVKVSENIAALAVRDDGRFIAIGTMFTGSVAIYIAFSLQRALVVPDCHSMFVTGLEFLPSKDTSSIAMPYETSVISISVDNKISVHNLNYRPTISPWLALFCIILTLFATFLLCSYIGL